MENHHFSIHLCQPAWLSWVPKKNAKKNWTFPHTMSCIYLPIYHQKSTVHVGKYLYIILYISAPMDPIGPMSFSHFGSNFPFTGRSNPWFVSKNASVDWRNSTYGTCPGHLSPDLYRLHCALFREWGGQIWVGGRLRMISGLHRYISYTIKVAFVSNLIRIYFCLKYSHPCIFSFQNNIYIYIYEM